MYEVLAIYLLKEESSLTGFKKEDHYYCSLIILQNRIFLSSSKAELKDRIDRAIECNRKALQKAIKEIYEILGYKAESEVLLSKSII